MTGLDRPVWQSLTGPHARFAKGNAAALRFLPDVNMFASSRTDTRADMEALAALVQPGEQVYVLQVPEIRIPELLQAVKQAMGVQMVYRDADLERYSDTEIAVLGPQDAADMLRLATLTEPGPFLPRTHEMGRFIGVRRDGQLAAMAGERMRFDGYCEVSGVCTHPDFRGQGLAGRLSAIVARNILARGETPFLHAWATNQAAIRLYEKLGFQVRCPVHAAILLRPAR